jgi:ribonuclease-3
LTPPDRRFGALEENLGYTFADEGLLQRALAHRSFCSEHPGNASNERLEFLGDAVLGVVVTDRIYADYPDLPEGELAKVRAAVVSSEALASVAVDLALGTFILLGRGEEGSGGRGKPSILADSMEAVIGAVYLDGGLSAATALVLHLLEERIAEAAEDPGTRDFKTRLQELAIHAVDEIPRYEVVDSGPDHAKEFEATVYLGGVPRGSGAGSSKKQAEQVAAAEAWEWLREQVPIEDQETMDA